MYRGESDVVISGSGVSGLYAAILLSKLGLSVHIISSEKEGDSTTDLNKNELVIFSPRNLQLLHQLDLLTTITQRGKRHFKFDIYQTRGYGNQATRIDQQTIRLWDNEATIYNYCISCKKNVVREIFQEYLLKEYGVAVDYEQQIVDVKEASANIYFTNFKEDMLSSTSSVLQEGGDKGSNGSGLHESQQPGSPTPLPIYGSLLLSQQQQQKQQHKQQNENDSGKLVYLRDAHDNVAIWKSQAIFGADGSYESFVRQKLEILQTKEKTQLREFYTLQIAVLKNTDYPSMNQMSTISKNMDILFIIGTQDELHITFQHSPTWSKTSIDDEIPVGMAIRHIKSILEPFQIEFGQTKSYKRWNGQNYSSEEYITQLSADHKNYFLIGSCAQHINPPGLFDTAMHLEQIHNLCWKLALSLQNCASSTQLFQTFEAESKSKMTEAMNLSNTFTHVMGDYYYAKQTANSQFVKDIEYQLLKFKNCFIGTSLYLENTLNKQSSSLPINEFLFNEPHQQEEEHDCDTASVGSFKFVAPPPDSTAFSNGTSTIKGKGVGVAAEVGQLAPNAKLKPYSLFQLLLITYNSPLDQPTKSTSTKSLEDELLSAATKQLQLHQQQQAKTASMVNLAKAKEDNDSKKKKNNSSSSTNATNGSNGGIWSVLPLLQKKGNGIKRTSNGNNNTNNSDSPSNTTTTATTATGTTHWSEGWKSIRTTTFYLLDQIPGFTKHGGLAFTILIFLDSLFMDEKTSNFLKQLNSSDSFLHRYEQYHFKDRSNNLATNTGSKPQQNRDSYTSSTSSHSSHSSPLQQQLLSAVSGIESQSGVSSDNSSSFYLGNSNIAAQQKYNADSRRESTDSSQAHRFPASISTILSMHQQNSTNRSKTNSMFSTMFISNSSKDEAVRYLKSTAPTTIQSAFPDGLDHVFLDHDAQCYNAYRIKPRQPEVLVVRPDGYIGTRISIHAPHSVEQLGSYFDSFLRPVVDINSVAAIVAANYEL